MQFSGQESVVEVREHDVVKRYNNRYTRWNERYHRKGEPYFLRTYSSHYFVSLLEERDGAVVLERGEGCLGSSTEFSGDHFANCDKAALREWLLGLKSELDSLGIRHQDINPSNIIKTGKSFRLIDFGWAVESSAETRRRPRGLNGGFGSDDGLAIDRLVARVDEHDTRVAKIKSLIARLGAGRYRDGSSVTPGWTYHPIPFVDFADVPAHKTAARHELATIRACLEKQGRTGGGRLLDVGCANGFFTFQLRNDFTQVVAIEADPDAAAVINELCRLYHISNVELRNQRLQASDFGRFDVMLCLNVHMWIHKQLGHDSTKELMTLAAASVGQLFFQTAHAESRGMSIVRELRNRADIEGYLSECGFGDVQCLCTTTRHGGIRYLFHARGFQPPAAGTGESHLFSRAGKTSDVRPANDHGGE